MVVTFPHLGPMAIAARQLFSYLKIPCVIPPDNGTIALEKGTQISPEEACVPFKYMVGNLMEAYEKGADTAIMIATCGPCRLGEYGELLRIILENAGCRYRWILLDSPSVIGMKALGERISSLGEEFHITKKNAIRGFTKGIQLIFTMDRFRRNATKAAGFLEKPGDAVRLLHKTEEMLKRAESFQACRELLKAAEKELAEFERKREGNPVNVLIAGEIYTSIESEANGRLEEKLMGLGCSVVRHIDISWWIKHTIIDALPFVGLMRPLMEKGGISCSVGGYGRETVTKILRSSSYDGIIKVMPSGCMPEIVTKAFCESLLKEHGYRILHLIYDEMSGQAGYETRIEAFVDVLERRKHVLAGNRRRIHKHRSGVGR